MNALRDFWNVVADVWTHGIWGVDVGRILLALLILGAFMLVRHLIVRGIMSFVRRSPYFNRYGLPQSIANALERPFGFIPIALGVFFAIQVLVLNEQQAELGYLVVRSLVVIVIFWSLHNLVGPLSFLLRRLERVFTPELVAWVEKTIRISFIFIGAATVLELWGVEIAPVLAGLGLVGIAVALGAQDLFKNLIGGLLILAEKQFRTGDWIHVEGVVEGVVEDVGFRTTVVRRFDHAPVFVPNARFAENPITNFSRMTHRRIFWKIGVVYGSSVEQLREIREKIEAYILGNSHEFVGPSEAPTFVRIDNFNESSIDILVYCFTRTTVWGEWLEIKERLAYRVKDVVEEAGSSFAFPSRSLYVEAFGNDAAELFVPPSSDNEPAAPGKRPAEIG